MQYVSFRDLQNIAPSILRKKLTSEGALVATVNNKAFAAMISLDEVNVQDTMLVVSRLRVQMAALSIRNQARKDGMDKTTLKEVNAVINRTRAEQNKMSKRTKYKWTFVLFLTPYSINRLTHHNWHNTITLYIENHSTAQLHSAGSNPVGTAKINTKEPIKMIGSFVV